MEWAAPPPSQRGRGSEAVQEKAVQLALVIHEDTVSENAFPGEEYVKK